MADENKKKDDDLDFDFSEMDGTKAKAGSADDDLKVVKPRKGWKPETKKKGHRDPADPVLAIPVEGGWVSRSIGEATPEEFCDWFRVVYPGVLCEPGDFKTKSSKIRAFKHVLKESIQMKFKDRDHALVKN